MATREEVMPISPTLTAHARVRMQQRAVRLEVVQWLLQFGSRTFDGRGAQIRFFDERARERIRRTMGEDALRRAHDRLDSYAVVANDGRVLTVGHRYRRRRRR